MHEVVRFDMKKCNLCEDLGRIDSNGEMESMQPTQHRWEKDMMMMKHPSLYLLVRTEILLLHVNARF